MVYAKVAILAGFALAGLWGILYRPDLHFFAGGVLPGQPMAPVIAVGAIFVSFEGFQLLAYEYTEMEHSIETLKWGILVSIVLSTVIYVLVSLVTTQLVTPEQIMAHKETILAFAASTIFESQLVNQVAYVLIAVAALFSTASAINATLFGTARLGYKVAREKGLPSLFSFRDKRGIPTRSLLLVGALTALFTFLGTLEEITTFASVAFILVFGVVNVLCLKEKQGSWAAAVPAVGVAGTGSALVFLLWHLVTRRPEMLVFIAIIFALVTGMEFLYMEREPVVETIEEVEELGEDIRG